MVRKKDSSVEYSVDDSTRIAPYLTYEGIMLMQINRCNDSYSNRHVNFTETTRILEFCSIPLFKNKKEYKEQEAKIDKMTEQKRKEYREMARQEFSDNFYETGFYADQCNEALFEQIQHKYLNKMRNAVAEEKYKILLDNGRIRKTFRSQTGSDKL